MKTRLSPGQLCRKHRDEGLHSGQVTALALELFDRTRKALGLPAGERRLLKAAACLHDVGFASRPAAHAKRSATIVMRQGLAGFTKSERDVIAAAIRIHSTHAPGRAGAVKAAAALFRREGFRLTPEDRQRVWRVAAFLRVADALDHAHIQTASIESVRIKNRQVKVEVASPGYPGVIRQAERKADLWNDGLPLPIRFKAARSGGKRRSFAGVLKRNQTVRESLRRLMFLHHRLMLDARANILERCDPVDLHDLRVAMRRVRSSLRMYEACHPSRSVERVSRGLVDMSTRLGVIRDVQAWWEFLQAVRPPVTKDRAWPAYRRTVERRARRETARLARMIQGRAWQSLVEDVTVFLRVELPGLPPGGTFRGAAEDRVRRIYERIGEGKIDIRRMSSDAFHELRRRIRRGRYWAEFLVPVGGRPVRRLAARLKDAADALGDLHDADVWLAMLAGRRAALRLPRLEAELQEIRERALSDFQWAWKRLYNRDFRKTVLGGLSTLRRNDG